MIVLVKIGVTARRDWHFIPYLDDWLAGRANDLLHGTYIKEWERDGKWGEERKSELPPSSQVLDF